MASKKFVRQGYEEWKNELKKDADGWFDDDDGSSHSENGGGDNGHKAGSSSTDSGHGTAIDEWEWNGDGMDVDDDYKYVDGDYQTMKMEQELERQQRMAENPRPPALKVKVNVYENFQPIAHQQLIQFKITAEQKFLHTTDLPMLACDVSQLDSVMKNLVLSSNWTANTFIAGHQYIEYRKLKWTAFNAMITTHALRDRMPDDTFVAFSGVLATLLGTTIGHDKWTIIAWKQHGKIYLKKVRYEERETLPRNDGRQWQNFSRQPRFDWPKRADRIEEAPNMTHLLKFQQLATGGNVNEPVNEFEKHFLIFSAEFGSHQLLLLTELDAVDSDGGLYKFAMKSPRHSDGGELAEKFTKRKLPELWAQSVLTNSRATIVGQRDHDGSVTKVEVIDREGWENQLESNMVLKQNLKPQIQLDFLNRFLDYVKVRLSDVGPDEMGKFYFSAKHMNPNVNFEKLPMAEP